MKKEKTRKYLNMLRNAGIIQWHANILFDEEFVHDESDLHYFWTDGEKWWLAYHDENGHWTDCECSFWVVKFFIKGRKLRGGLATPMARYYGWKAIRKMDAQKRGWI